MIARPFALLLLVFLGNSASAQSSPQQLAPILGDRVQPSAIVEFELRHYLVNRLTKMPAPTSAEQWTSEAAQLRQHLLNDIVFHGWPKEWVDAPPQFKDLGVIGSSTGYRLRKSRYERDTDSYSTELTYQPSSPTGK